MTAVVYFRDVNLKLGELSIPKCFVYEVEGGGDSIMWNAIFDT